MINIEIVKQQIINYLNEKGPSLPLHIAKTVELSPMFTSAILSELTNIKKVKTSSLKVGSSPLYLLPGQEQQLERFAENLSGVEKEAFLKLKSRKVLQDETQPPALRVALRSIRDFAFPFKINDQMFWRYTFTPEQEIKNILNSGKANLTRQTPTPHQPQTPYATPQTHQQIYEKPKQLEPIFEYPKEKSHSKTKAKNKKSNQNFLEEISPTLESKGINIISLEEVDKRKVIAIANLNSQRVLLAAFNKKRVTELEILKIYRKASDLGMPYYILSKGEPTKKQAELIEAYKNLTKLDKI